MHDTRPVFSTVILKAIRQVYESVLNIEVVFSKSNEVLSEMSRVNWDHLPDG